jgi:hypothetical protein
MAKRPTLHDDDALPHETNALRSWRRDLVDLPALCFADVAFLLGLPPSTLDKIRRTGKGPKFFLLGRRLYCSRQNLIAWIDELSKEEV